MEFLEEKKKEINNTVKQTLIPSGGTDWQTMRKLINHNGGHRWHNVCKIPISSDSRITVSDYVQLASDKEGYEEFCTGVCFFKEALPPFSIQTPYWAEKRHIYDFFYPYGTRFDEDMLLQIGTALSILIDMERSATNLEQVTQSRTIQQQLLDLFRNGSDNKNAVSQIMEGITLSIEDENVLSK